MQNIFVLELRKWGIEATKAFPYFLILLIEVQDTYNGFCIITFKWTLKIWQRFLHFLGNAWFPLNTTVIVTSRNWNDPRYISIRWLAPIFTGFTISSSYFQIL